MWFSPITWSCEVGESPNKIEYIIQLEHKVNVETNEVDPVFRVVYYAEDGHVHGAPIVNSFKEARDWCKEHYKQWKSTPEVENDETFFDLQSWVSPTTEGP